MRIIPHDFGDSPTFTALIGNYYVSFQYDGLKEEIQISGEHTPGCEKLLLCLDGKTVTIGQGDDYTIVISGDVDISVPEIIKLTDIPEFCIIPLK
jgi:hypothetical protein